MTRVSWVFVGLILHLSIALSASAAQAKSSRRRNVIIFVADGLRHGSVNEKDCPTLLAIRKQGVHFKNSHSLFPTLTTANAAAIATGHGAGDTGDFSNTMWVGYPMFNSGNFGLAPGSPIPFVENDQALADMDDHFGGNYLGEETLLQLARKNGYNTATVGKVGPAGIQDASALALVNGKFSTPPATIIVDDATGTPNGLPLSPQIIERLLKENLAIEAPTRSNGYGPTSPYNNGYGGDNSKAGTLRPNTVQQQWFVDVVTRVILPLFESAADKPFALVFWSRDPDGTQHNQGDSLGALHPGINGESSFSAVRNADHDLRQLLDWLDSHPAIRGNTDIFVTSDHGFATISRREIDRNGHPTSSESAKHYYLDATGRVETDRGVLPLGFLAIDLALGLKTNLFDPDQRGPNGSRKPYKQLRLALDAWEHPLLGNGLLGDDILKPDGADAKAIIASNGGSDLIYVPDGSKDMVGRIVNLLLTYDYVGGVFVDDKYGPNGGALPLSAIWLEGSSVTPRPTVVVAFKVFYLNPADIQTAVQISDTSLQEGQGMHGGLGRDSTYNNMAAIGPDFKRGFVDIAPASNADIAPTLARVMGMTLSPKGRLTGRVLEEALATGPEPAIVRQSMLASTTVNGMRTVLNFQELQGEHYLDAACLVGSGVEDTETQCTESHSK
ncbi:MAG TPA: alkaline phosphatase family protein [Terriglobales bacterium]|nr:alkaline phosphatase family protein [Terriglobales bacterium]